MKLLISLTFLLFLCIPAIPQSAGNDVNPVSGKWVRITQTGPVALDFKEAGMVEVDFGNDGSTDVTSSYTFRNDTIVFSDREGAMCPEAGVYRLTGNDCYLAFDLADDECGGRLRMTMGYWTRPGFNELLEELSAKLKEAETPDLHLTRARVYLATGNSAGARADLDAYINQDKGNSRAFINRAGTRFPGDMQGVIADCNKAIELEPGNKNAWFMRGLAQYELGEKEKACDDFSRAIELGFSILKMAEENRCREYWQEKQ